MKARFSLRPDIIPDIKSCMAHSILVRGFTSEQLKAVQDAVRDKRKKEPKCNQNEYCLGAILKAAGVKRKP